MRRSFASTLVAFFVVGMAAASCANGTSQTSSGGDDTSDAGGTVDASASDATSDAMGGDCPTLCTGTTPFCDRPTQKCVACLPTNDMCPATTYCQKDANSTYQCAPGCKTTADCTQTSDGGGALACCGNKCVDTTSNAQSCGTCGHSCSTDGGGTGSCCSSVCVDTSSNANNCSACGKKCTASHAVNATCAMATCGFDTCYPGYGDCDSDKTNGCETPTSADPQRCGGCTSVCSSNHVPTPSCNASLCDGTCAAGYADCNANKLTDGCEIGTQSDAQNCGGCGAICSNSHIMTPVCTVGACTGACDSGYADCNSDKRVDGCEVATAADPTNCGGCSVVCSRANIATPTCGAGVCNGACNAGWGDCNANKQTDGCERPLTTLTDCGGCGTPCAPANASGATCATIACDYGLCNAGFLDCDSNRANGCEVNKNTDNSHCGNCATVCTGGQTCSGGVCSSKVLLAASDGIAAIQALQTALQGTGAFSAVDAIDVTSASPTVAQLQAYGVVMSWTNSGGYTVANETAFFDNLATYYDGGGRVVLAMFAVGGWPAGAVGRFLQPGNGYMLFNVSTANAYTSGGSLTLGTVFEPASALMSGVATATYGTTSFWSTEPLVAGAVVVANWSNGVPFIVRGTAQGRKRVDLNLYPNPSYWGGNTITAIKNALLYL